MIKTQTGFNTTWIAGTPRTGSMWTTNITRQIFQVSGYNIFPDKQYQDDDDCIKSYTNRSLPETSSSNKYVYKVHKLLKLNLSRSKYIVNIRNPYEILTSFYHFMKCDLERAINIAKRHAMVIDYYSKMSQENLLKIRYEDIELNSINIVKEIATFLLIDLSMENIELISDKFTKEKVQLSINKCDADLLKKIKETGKVNKNEVVIISPVNIRAFDVNTGFQTGHISNRSSSKWRDIFSKNEVKKIIDSIDSVAVQLGYESEKNKEK